MPERAAAHPDREPRRLGALHEDVAGGGVPGLVDRDRARLRRDVLDPDRGARLDRRHRLDEVLPGEAVAPVVVGERQRHRAHLLDHRGRVAVRDPRDLVAPLRRVEVGLVRRPW